MIKKLLQSPRLLVVSLIFNLFLVGGLIACLYHFKWLNPPGNFNNRQQLGLRFAAKSLSEEQQKTFKRALRETRLKANDLSETANDARDKARKIIADDDFDKQKLQEELNRAREADIALRIRIETTLVNFAETLNPEERKNFAEGLSTSGPLRQAAMIEEKYLHDSIGQ